MPFPPRDGLPVKREFVSLLVAAIASFGCAAHDAGPRSAETCGCSVERACPAGFACESGLCMPLEQPFPAAPVVASAAVAAPPAPPKETRLILDGTEVHEVMSKTNGRAYQIVVAPPAKPEPGKRVATVYVLDGYWDFPLVHAMRGALHYDEAIPDVMLVGIGYAGQSPDIPALRASDYTPTPHASRADSGRAPEFLRFIESELFPFIESRYPSDPAQRVLAGVSYGGLFTLYTLFEKPELFYGYVSMTPAVNWDDGWILKRERDFAKTKRPPLAQRLWLSFGEAEKPETVKRGSELMRELESHKLPGLALRTRMIEGERHAGMKNESYNRGLRFVLAPLAAKPSK
jgi:predicted alpha/beta superfamily hydrolase